MGVEVSTSWSWEVATDVEEIHSLLCACDAYTATLEAPPPVRNIETTRRRVQSGSVHLLRFGASAVAMFTLTWEAPFTRQTTLFPPAKKPAYMGRLAVQPEWLAKGSIASAQCIRKAMELAGGAGADAIRLEANPDLTRIRTLLGLFGFEEYGRTQSEDGRRQVYMQKSLEPDRG